MTDAETLLPCPQWKIDLIKGFPWESDDPNADLERSYACQEAGLLDLHDTQPGTSEAYEYGETVFRFTDLGKLAYEYAHRAPVVAPVVSRFIDMTADELSGLHSKIDMAKSSRRALHPSQLTDDEADLIAKSKMPDPADRSQNTEY